MIYENRWVKGTITAASFGVATVLIVAVVGAVIWPAMFGLAFELALTVGGWVLHTAEWVFCVWLLVQAVQGVIATGVQKGIEGAEVRKVRAHKFQAFISPPES
jgi:hypothetical protein